MAAAAAWGAGARVAAARVSRAAVRVVRRASLRGVGIVASFRGGGMGRTDGAGSAGAGARARVRVRGERGARCWERAQHCDSAPPSDGLRKAQSAVY
ncbi:hypothetical protein GCM10027168_57530 [Streptomyces capparidis]